MTEQKPKYETQSRAATFIRVAKNPDNPFVMIDRRPIENPKMSWKAKGLLAYLLSRPDDWVIRFRDLVNRSPDGAHTVRAAMKELKDAGHVQVRAEREGGRVKQWVYVIKELPDVDFQQVEKQQVENQTYTNNKDLNKKKLKVAATPKPPTPQEVQAFRKATRKYPNSANYPDVVTSVRKVMARLGKENIEDIVIDELSKFYRRWTGKGYNPFNLAWLEWAEAGTVPTDGTWRPKNANYQGNTGGESYTPEDIAAAERIKARRAGL